jgi:ribose transport system substrate-binding protein
LGSITAKRGVPMLLAVLLTGMALTACGSSEDSSSAASESTSGGSATSTSNGDQTSGAGIATAEQAIAPLLSKPSAFPVTEKLDKIPRGATVAFMDCGSPICGLYYEVMAPAAQALGLHLTRVKAGSAASTVGAAFDTVVSQEVDAVIVPGIDPELYSRQLGQLQESGAPVITVGVTNAEEFGIEHPAEGRPSFERNGQLLADYVATKFGPDSQAVVYATPELPFTAVFSEAFETELERVCPDCSTRVSELPLETIGSTAPQRIVSDLQANPETSVAVFPNDEAQIGLPAALKAAGVEIKTIGEAPTPTNLQYLKEGKETAVLGSDLPVLGWTVIDLVARELTGQKITGDEAKGFDTDQQFLVAADIGDPERGWTGYPEFAERFAELWGLGH